MTAAFAQSRQSRKTGVPTLTTPIGLNADRLNEN